MFRSDGKLQASGTRALVIDEMADCMVWLPFDILGRSSVIFRRTRGRNFASQRDDGSWLGMLIKVDELKSYWESMNFRWNRIGEKTLNGFILSQWGRIPVLDSI